MKLNKIVLFFTLLIANISFAKSYDYLMYDVPFGFPREIEVKDLNGTTYYEFNKDGELINVNGHDLSETGMSITRNEAGYPETVIVESDGSKAEAHYEYLNGKVSRVSSFSNGKINVIEMSYDKKGENNKAVVDGTTTIKYSIKERDSKGNWTIRIATANGLKWEESRIISYQGTMASINDPRWKEIVGTFLTAKVILDGDNLTKCEPPYKVLKFNSYTQKFFGNFFPWEGTFMTREGHLEIYHDGKLVEEFTLINPNQNGYVILQSSDGKMYFFTADPTYYDQINKKK